MDKLSKTEALQLLKNGRVSQRILNLLSMEDLRTMPKEILYNVAKQTGITATKRRERAENFIEATGIQQGTAFNTWSRQAQGRENIQNYWEANFNPTKEMSRNELLHQVRLNMRFLQTKTSTITGMKKEFTAFINRLEGTKNGKRIKFNEIINNPKYTSNNYWSKFWNIYSRIKKGEFDGVDYFSRMPSEKIMQLIQETLSENPYNFEEDIIQIMQDKARGQYEADDEANSRFTSHGGFTL